MSPNAQHPVRRSASADSTSTSRFLKASERLRDLRSLRHILSRAARKEVIRLSEVRSELQDHVGLAVTVSETAHLCRLHLPSLSLYRPADEHHDVAAMPFALPSVLCDADDGFSWSSRLCQGVEAAFDDVEHVSLELDESVPLHDCLDRRRLVRLAERCADGQTHEVHVDHERMGERESDHLIRAMALAGFSSHFGEPEALLYYHEGFRHLGTIVIWPASGKHVGGETIDTLHAHESAIVELLTARIAVRQARLPQLRPAYLAVEAASDRWRLSPKRRDVLALLVKGLSSTEVADALSVSQSTVNSHLAALYRAAGVNSMQGLLVAVLGPMG